MNKRQITIIQAAVTAIRQINKPSTALEIYEHIVQNNLYQFNAKDPQSILKSALRRHSNDMASSNKQASLLLRQVENNKYQLR